MFYGVRVQGCWCNGWVVLVVLLMDVHVQRLVVVEHTVTRVKNKVGQHNNGWKLPNYMYWWKWFWIV